MKSHLTCRVEDAGGVRLEIWQLADAGWDDWAGVVDRFLKQAIESLHLACGAGQMREIHINLWPDGGRLIVFVSEPADSRDPPGAGYLEMDAGYIEASYADFGSRLDAAHAQCPEAHPIALQWAQWELRLWSRIADCLSGGEASMALRAVRSNGEARIRATNWDESEQRLVETRPGTFAAVQS